MTDVEPGENLENESSRNDGRAERARAVLGRTGHAIRVVVTRRDATLILLSSIGAYLALYSFMTGALSATGRPGFAFQVVADPLSRMFQQTGFLSFEPIARVQALGFSYLFSPIEGTLAFTLAILVGMNFGISYLGIVQPSACGLAPSSGIFAAAPALLSGAACCGPLIFVILGIQATGALFAGVQLLLPLSILLLVGSLLVVGQRIDPARIDSAA